MIKEGDVGLDFAFSPELYVQMKRDGAKFVCRYSAGTASDLGKVTGTHEIFSATRAGLDFIANFELSEDTPEQGSKAGREHGKADHDFWLDRGLAPGAGVIVSWEPGNDARKFRTVGNFLSSYKAAIGRPIGLYAGLPALLYFRKRDLIDFTWLPMSAAASNLTGFPTQQRAYARFMEKVGEDHGLNLVQNRNRWYGGGADEDKLVTLPKVPFSHLQALDHAKPTPDKPTPQPTPLFHDPRDSDVYIICSIDHATLPAGVSTPGIWLLGSGYHHIASKRDLATFRKLKLAEVTITYKQHQEFRK